MVRSILITVLVSIIFAGFESAADSAGPMVESGHAGIHEVHTSPHMSGHEHDGDDHDDEHFCHCSVHTAAIFSIDAICPLEERSVAPTGCDNRFSSLADPPLLRPPSR
jgi:hypothetical protein